VTGPFGDRRRADCPAAGQPREPPSGIRGEVLPGAADADDGVACGADAGVRDSPTGRAVGGAVVGVGCAWRDGAELVVTHFGDGIEGGRLAGDALSAFN
jgi:hypothetical protein